MYRNQYSDTITPTEYLCSVLCRYSNSEILFIQILSMIRRESQRIAANVVMILRFTGLRTVVHSLKVHANLTRLSPTWRIKCYHKF